MKQLIISPEQLIIDSEIIESPECITILLPNGHAYPIDEIIAILEQVDKKKPSKKRFKFISRVKRGATAFKQAMRDMDDEPTDIHPNRVIPT